MSAHHDLILLKMVKTSIKQIEWMVESQRITESGFEFAIPKSVEYMARAAICKEMESIVECLTKITDPTFIAKHPDVFDRLPRLIPQRNITVHEYGQPDSKIYWRWVWKTVSVEYPDLEKAVLEAIDDLENRL